MSNENRRRAIGYGLPRCLDGLEELQKPLYLSSSTRPTRRSVLRCAFVRERIGASVPEGASRGDTDRLRLTAFYANPETRRELWNLHRDQSRPATSVPRSGPNTRPSRARLLPPSLERNLLKRYLNAKSTGADEAPALEAAAEGVKQRLDDWQALSPERQYQTTLEVFCLATVLDAQAVIDDACDRVPSLNREFESIRGDEHTDSEEAPEESCEDGPCALAKSWESICRSLAETASDAAGPPPNLKMLEEMQKALSMLAKLEPELQAKSAARTTLRELQDRASAFLDEVASDPNCSMMNPGELAGLRGRWTDLSGIRPTDARAELDRMDIAVPESIKAVAEAYTACRKVDEKLQELGTEEPTGWSARRDLEDAMDEYQAKASRRRRERRAREEHLLRELTPQVERRDSELARTPVKGKQESESAAPGSVEPASRSSDTVPQAPREKPAAMSETPPAVTAERRSTKDSEANSPAPKVEEQPEPEAVEEESEPEASVNQPIELRHQQDDAAVEALPGDSPRLSDEGRSGAIRPDVPTPAIPETQEERSDVISRSQASSDSRARAAGRALAEALAAEPPRLAYAYQLVRLLEELEIKAGQPPSALVEAALYASCLQHSQGDLATALDRSIQEALAAPRDQGQTADAVNAAALIGFAGALRPALLAPWTSAATYLRQLRHEGFAPLYDFAEKIAAGSEHLYRTGIDTSRFLRLAQTESRRKEETQDFARDLKNWSEDKARKLQLNYTPANNVWRALCESDGEIGRLVQAMRSPGNEAEVRLLLETLGPETELREVVDRIARRVLNRRQNIDRKIFKQLRSHLADPLTLAQRYVDLQMLAAPNSGHRIQGVERLVDATRREAPILRKQLEEMAGAGRKESLLAATAHTATYALRRVETILNSEGRKVTAEPSPEQLVASGLYTYPELRLGEDGRPEGGPERALRVLLNSQPVSLNDALERNLRLGDMATADLIAGWMVEQSEGDGRTDEPNESVRDRLCDRKRELERLLEQDLDEVRERLEQAYALGQIDTELHQDCLTTLNQIDLALETKQVRRFDRRQDELAAIRQSLESAADATAAELRDRARKRLPPRGGRFKRIERYLKDGDILAANELLDLPEGDGDSNLGEGDAAGDAVDALDRFLTIGAESLKAVVSSWPRLRKAATTGDVIGELDFGRLDEGERYAAERILGAWAELKRRRTSNADRLAEATKVLLAALGFLDVHVEIDGKAEPDFAAIRFTAETLRHRSDCPAPYFGSSAHGRYRALLFFGVPTAEQFLRRAQQHRDRRPTIAIYFGPLGEQTRLETARLCRQRHNSLVLLDELILVFLASCRSPRLATLFACTLPFTYTRPFITQASLVPPEMFFGREGEARSLRDFNGSCFVYGGRQLGKTALLRHVAREFTNRNNGQVAIWLNLKAEGVGHQDTADIWPAIWTALSKDGHLEEEEVPRPTRSAPRIRAFVRYLHKTYNSRSGRSLLLLLDEADDFLEQDARNSDRETFREASRLKALMDDDRSIKVVFAGLHNVQRTADQSNHPLAHLGEPIRIGAFLEPKERVQAARLLSEPLRACGYRFESNQLVHRILAQTNYYPSLIQLYGSALLRTVSEAPMTGPPPWVIDRRVLDRTYQDQNLREAIRLRFEWTLQLDPRYEVIAYAVARECQKDRELLDRGIDHNDLRRNASGWWFAGFEDINRDADRFRALLDEMVGLGVLRVTDALRHRYSLRSSNVLGLLGTVEDVENKLLAERQLRRVLDTDVVRRSYRRGREKAKGRVTVGPLHLPLTLRQEAQIFGHTQRSQRSRNAVVLVCGLGAAGLEHLAGFLDDGYGEAGYAGGFVRQRELLTPSAFEDELRTALSRRGYGTTVFGVSDGCWNETWVEAARSLLAGLRSADRFARVLFGVDANQLRSFRPHIKEWRQRGDVEVVRLHPWALDFVLDWFGDDPVMGPVVSGASERKHVARWTGGWPVLLDLLRVHVGDGTGVSTVLENFEDTMRAHVPELRTAFGLNDPDLESLLYRMKEYGALTFGELRDLTAGELSDDALHSAFWIAEQLHLISLNEEDIWQVDGAVKRILELASDRNAV